MEDELTLAIKTFAAKIQPVCEILKWRWVDVGAAHIEARLENLIPCLMKGDVDYVQEGGLLLFREADVERGFLFSMFIDGERHWDS